MDYPGVDRKKKRGEAQGITCTRLQTRAFERRTPHEKRRGNERNHCMWHLRNPFRPSSLGSARADPLQRHIQQSRGFRKEILQLTKHIKELKSSHEAKCREHETTITALQQKHEDEMIDCIAEHERRIQELTNELTRLHEKLDKIQLITETIEGERDSFAELLSDSSEALQSVLRSFHTALENPRAILPADLKRSSITTDTAVCVDNTDPGDDPNGTDPDADADDDTDTDADDVTDTDTDDDTDDDTAADADDDTDDSGGSGGSGGPGDTHPGDDAPAPDGDDPGINPGGCVAVAPDHSDAVLIDLVAADGWRRKRQRPENHSGNRRARARRNPEEPKPMSVEERKLVSQYIKFLGFDQRRPGTNCALVAVSTRRASGDCTDRRTCGYEEVMNAIATERSNSEGSVCTLDQALEDFKAWQLTLLASQ